jgi:hypothetical protein
MPKTEFRVLHVAEVAGTPAIFAAQADERLQRRAVVARNEWLRRLKERFAPAASQRSSVRIHSFAMSIYLRCALINFVISNMDT